MILPTEVPVNYTGPDLWSRTNRWCNELRWQNQATLRYAKILVKDGHLLEALRLVTIAEYDYYYSRYPDEGEAD